MTRRRFLGTLSGAAIAASGISVFDNTLSPERAAASHNVLPVKDVDGVVYRKANPVQNPLSNYPGFHPEVKVLKAGSTFSGSRWHGGTRPLPTDILFERDVAVEMRDCTTIYVDVFRPPGAERVPALLVWSPYGKEGGHWSHDRDLTNSPPLIGADPRLQWISGLQKFEGPDPAEWVARGYAVINADSRGAFYSEGDTLFFGKDEARDIYDTIEWIAKRDWSNENVGMQGNSWLAICQWFAAAEAPPHLKAIAPWNGCFDLYEAFSAPGGIPSVTFPELLIQMNFGNNYIEDVTAMVSRHPLKNEYWDAHSAELENITIPTYATVGNFRFHNWTYEAWRRISSADKWLRMFTVGEWHDQYNPKYVADLARFFDRYLKDARNNWEATPRVRVCVFDPGLDLDKAANKQWSDSVWFIGPAAEIDRPENEWPLARTQYNKLHLDPDAGKLSPGRPSAESAVRYLAIGGKATFTHTFDEVTEVTGYPVAKLWVEVAGSEDADLFLYLDKLDDDGQFLGRFEATRLRVSHRELDSDLSTPFRPYYTHRTRRLLAPGQIVPVDIGFHPRSMLFHPGQQLRLAVTGTPEELTEPPTGTDAESNYRGLELLLAPTSTVNAGMHIIHTGGSFDSALTIPVVPPR